MDVSNFEFQIALNALSQLDGVPVHLELPAFDAFMLVGQIQLALRHPENSGPSAEVARRIAITIQEGLISRVPELQSILEKGWHPEFDIPSS